MKKIIYMMMSFIMATLMAMPVKAQNVIEGEVVEPQDDTEVTDSTMLDSLAADRRWVSWSGIWMLIPASTSTTNDS